MAAAISSPLMAQPASGWASNETSTTAARHGAPSGKVDRCDCNRRISPLDNVLRWLPATESGRTDSGKAINQLQPAQPKIGLARDNRVQSVWIDREWLPYFACLAPCFKRLAKDTAACAASPVRAT